MRETISIIVPVYNRKNVFLRSLASVYAQTYRPIQVIVVDDGSTEFDVRKIDLKSPREISIIKIRQEHKGAQAARNRGFEQSRGEFVLFWDADIIAEPNFVETLCSALKEHEGAGYAYGNFYWGIKKIQSRAFDPMILKQTNYIHMGCLMRRSVCIPFDETIQKFQDWDMWLTLLERGVYGVWVDDFLYKIIPGGFISIWIPKCFYKKPWKYIRGIRGIVRKYEVGIQIIQMKHRLF